MALTQKETDEIIKFVRQEPRTIQDISRLIGRSWVTTDSYVAQIKERTGLINIKTFRKGSQGALKIAFYNHRDSSAGDDVKEELLGQIKVSRDKKDFDFFEVFQFMPDAQKRAFYEEYKDEDVSTKQNLADFLRQAKRVVYCFSGNLSFINMKENKVKIIDIFEELLEHKVMIKIICRINVASLNNISRLSLLIKKYPEFIEIRHSYQPLRGFIIDDSVARFKSEESLMQYKKGELQKNMRIFYEVHDAEWIQWLQKVFWSLFRTSIGSNSRLKQLHKFF